MCFHNALSVEAAKIENRFNAKFQNPTSFKPIYHGKGFDFLEWPVITAAYPQTVLLYNWGLIPYWVKKPSDALKIRTQTLNAKSESLFDKPAFRFSVKEKRCLVLSSGFFEWQHQNGFKKPFFIKPAGDELMAMGGLYSHWTSLETGETLHTFTIVTTVANNLLTEIHNTKKRMPLILRKEQESIWLDASLNENTLKEIMQPLDDGLLEAHSVSKLVSKQAAHTNVPVVQKPFNYPDTLQLF